MVHAFAVFVEMSCGDAVCPSLTGKFMQVFAPSPITGNVQVTGVWLRCFLYQQ